MLGLPCPSTALGLNSDDRPADPKQKFWVAPVVHVLAEKASYRPRIFIEGDDALKDEIVRVAGYRAPHTSSLPGSNPKGLPLPRPLEGSKPQGLRRLIYYAAFYLRGDIARPSSIPLVVMQDGKWALTEAGVAVAAHVRDAFATDGRNVTNVWLNGQINHHDLYTRLVTAITYDPTTRKERESGEVHDHVGHFLATKIKNDAFAARLSSCDPPTFREIRTYTLRATYTTFKRRAQDPLHRENRGALTDSERKAGGPTTAAMVVSNFARVIQTTDCIRSESVVPSEVIVDHSQVARDLHRLDFERGMDKVREAFRRFKPGNHDRIYRIFGLMAAGCSVAEIGDLVNTSPEREAALRGSGLTTEQIGRVENGVSRNRAATLMADTRGALRAARQASVDALVVLRYIAENPCSTLPDLAEDFSKLFTPRFQNEAASKAEARLAKIDHQPEDLAAFVKEATDTLVASAIRNWLSVMLDGLIENDRLESKDFDVRGRKDTVVGYIITDRGHGFIANRSSTSVSEGLLESLSL